MARLRDVVRPDYYWRQLKSVGGFLFRPRYDWPEETAASALIALFPLLILKMFFAILAVLSFYVFEALGVVAPLENAIGNLDWPNWQLILVGGLIVPFIEESAYRAHFRMKAWTGSLSAAAITYLVISAFTEGTRGLREGLYDETAPMRFAAAIGAGVIVYAILNAKPLLNALALVWRKGFTFIFWISIVYFGYSHLERYTNFSWEEHGIFVPLIILPQIIAAVFYTYTRMRYGFLWAVILHGMNNALPVVVFGYLITGNLD
ncbi:MAG: hypothetical protein AAFW68_10075 [Pseudomonadota bacterium]